MDMIAEILQTDKAAAGKLEKADMESGETAGAHSERSTGAERKRPERSRSL